MKTIFLIILLFIGSFHLTNATPQKGSLAYSVSYGIVPSSKQQKGKSSNQTLRLKPKPKPKKTGRKKIRNTYGLFYIFATIFVASIVGVLILVATIGLGYFGLAAFPFVLVGLASLIFTIIFSVRTSRVIKRKNRSTTKRTDAEIREEVPNLSEADANQYVDLNNQLVAINIKRNNFDKNFRTRLREGTKVKVLKKEIKAAGKEHKTLKRAIKKLEFKSIRLRK